MYKTPSGDVANTIESSESPTRNSSMGTKRKSDKESVILKSVQTKMDMMNINQDFQFQW